MTKDQTIERLAAALRAEIEERNKLIQEVSRCLPPFNELTLAQRASLVSNALARLYGAVLASVDMDATTEQLGRAMNAAESLVISMEVS